MTVEFTGVGLNDCSPGGTLTELISHKIKVVIDSTPGTDLCEWFLDGVSQGTFSCSTTPIALIYGMTCRFEQITGHTIGDYWEWRHLPLYPRTILPTYPYRPTRVKNVIRTQIKSGKTLSVRQWAPDSSRHRFNISYRFVPESSDTIVQFWDAQDGEHRQFDFVDFLDQEWLTVQFGEIEGESQADGTRKRFELPFDGATSVTIYDDGAVVSPAAYSIVAATGRNGRDDVLFNSAPGADSILKVGGTGALWHVANFDAQVSPSRRHAAFDTQQVIIIGDLTYG